VLNIVKSPHFERITVLKKSVCAYPFSRYFNLVFIRIEGFNQPNANAIAERYHHLFEHIGCDRGGWLFGGADSVKGGIQL
jgi:hypothetical protein